MERFIEGTEIQVSAMFPDGDPASEIAILIRHPDTTVHALPVDRLAAGSFASTLTLTIPGRWAVRVTAEGAVTESEFYVEASVL